MALIGYARVSTGGQDTALQLDALARSGVRHVFEDSGSGVGPRPQLQRALSSLRAGDLLVLWKIDRAARSLSDLLHILSRIKASGAAIKSLTEPIDTSNPIGEFTFQILGAVAQLERSMIRERVVAGQIAARARGKTWGPRRLLTEEEAHKAVTMWRSGWYEQRMLAEMFGMSESALRDTIHRIEKRGRWLKRPSEQ